MSAARSDNMSFADSEWRVMEFLWERSCCTGREASAQMQLRWGWSRSTTLTLLRRLETKGAAISETVDGVKVFRPLVCREDAELRADGGLPQACLQGQHKPYGELAH